MAEGSDWADGPPWLSICIGPLCHSISHVLKFSYSLLPFCSYVPPTASSLARARSKTSIKDASDFADSPPELIILIMAKPSLNDRRSWSVRPCKHCVMITSRAARHALNSVYDARAKPMESRRCLRVSTMLRAACMQSSTSIEREPALRPELYIRGWAAASSGEPEVLALLVPARDRQNINGRPMNIRTRQYSRWR